MVTKKALGRGLSALIPNTPVFLEQEINEAQADKSDLVQLINLQKIVPNPSQPRENFAEDKLLELAESLKEHGVIQPIIVTPQEDKYLIIAGERRFRAAQIAHLEKLPCIVRAASAVDIMEMALIENIQREDLNSLEEAKSYARLIEEFSYTQENLASKIGKSRPYITNMLRILSLPQEVLSLLAAGQISAGHCRAVLMVANAQTRIEFAAMIVKNKLSVRQAEDWAKKLKDTKPVKMKKEISTSPMIADIEKKFRNKLGTKVAFKDNGKSGQILIEYYSHDDLERLLEILLPNEEF